MKSMLQTNKFSVKGGAESGGRLDARLRRVPQSLKNVSCIELDIATAAEPYLWSAGGFAFSRI
jgi:hypothetical protein